MLRPLKNRGRISVCRKASQSLRPQAQIEFYLFSPATCASEKISHRRAGNPCVGQPVLSVLFALFSLAGDSPPASKRTKIPRKSKAVRCEAVLPEQKCSQARKRPQRILCVFSRALTQYEGISARQNRMFSCLSMANSARKRASAASALRRAAAFSNKSPTKWVSFESLSKIPF